MYKFSISYVYLDIETFRFNLSKIAVYDEIGLNDGILLSHGKVGNFDDFINNKAMIINIKI